jgi:hypothetical protein
MSGKSVVVDSAKYAEFALVFPASTDLTVAVGLTAPQIAYLASNIAKELQIQNTDPKIKDFLTRIMAQA